MSSRDFLNKLQKDFILNEAIAVNVNSYIQAIADIMETFVPKTIGDARRLEVARENLSNVRRHVRRLEEKIAVLEEENSILKEKKDV